MHAALMVDSLADESIDMAGTVALYQVALVAVNLHGKASGEPVQPGNQYSASAAPQGPFAPISRSASDRSCSPALMADVDRITAQRIQELRAKKDFAVAEENYDEAKALKLEIDRLKAVGSRILELEKRLSSYKSQPRIIQVQNTNSTICLKCQHPESCTTATITGWQL